MPISPTSKSSDSNSTATILSLSDENSIACTNPSRTTLSNRDICLALSEYHSRDKVMSVGYVTLKRATELSSSVMGGRAERFGAIACQKISAVPVLTKKVLSIRLRTFESIVVAFARTGAWLESSRIRIVGRTT
jgi:hypothetical protein